MFDNHFTHEAVKQRQKELIEEAEFYNQYKHVVRREARMARWFFALVLLLVIAAAVWF
jgi:hypothetical protein